VHEAAHAWAAHRGGDDTAYLTGQVSLNPWPHVRREPFGTVLVPILTFFANGWMMGWASAPYDPSWEDRHPRRAAAMSAAGPAANVALAAIAFVVLKLGIAAAWWGAPPSGATVDRLVSALPGAPAVFDALGRFLSVVMSLNIILGVFNLIPVPPLDGMGVVAGLVAPVRNVYQRVRAFPVASIVGVLLAWKLSSFVIRPAWLAAVHLLHGR